VLILALCSLGWTSPAAAQQLNRVDRGLVQQARADVHGDDVAGKDGPMARVGLELALLVREYEQHRQQNAAGPFVSRAVTSGPVRDSLVTLDLVARGGTAALIADLRGLGAEDLSASHNLVSARVPIGQLRSLARQGSLQSARLARATVRRESTSRMTEKWRFGVLVGDTDSQGDAAMNTDDVRAAFGLDGAGVTVGVLSDSYDTSSSASTTAADDVASGDLPPADRITVLDDEVVGSDEGRAMLQLIHDVAPGADLAFHTAFKGQADFANGIVQLADAGSDVIVDDVFYFAEPFFQDGVIAQAVDQVSAQGVPYFSSAGNSARQSYTSTSFNSITVDANDATPVYAFDPATPDTLQQVTIPVGGEVTLSLQWDDPFFSVTGDPGFAADTDLDIYLLSVAGDTLAASTTSNVGGDPVEIVSFTNDGRDDDNDGQDDTTFQIKIEKFAGPDPQRMKYIWSGSMTVDEFDTQSPTSLGHSIASGGAGVAAAFYGSPTQAESFTSVGGVPILFNVDGTRKSTPEVRNQPRVTGPDGTNTTFFGSSDPESDGFPNFFGTSAAAPHVAAVAALQLQGDPDLTPSQVYTGLADGALDIGDPGFDFRTGAGFVQADQTITASTIANEPNIEVVPTALDFGTSFLDPDTGTLFSTPSATIRVRNVGTAPLTISAVTLSGTGFTAPSGISTGTLAEDGEATGTITFDPSQDGTFSETYTIESDDPDQPTVTVTLEATALLPPVAAVSESSLFEAVETGATATQTLTIANTGDSELTYDVFAEAQGVGPFDPSEVAAPPTGSMTSEMGVMTPTALPAPLLSRAKQAFDITAFLYAVDDGSAENSLGFTSGADVFWMNAFQAQDGATTITAIASAFGGSLPVGSSATFFLYEDPTDDGDPTDAQLLRSVPTTTETAGNNQFQIEPVSPTQVEGVFFVAVLVPSTSALPAPLDQTADLGASWIAATSSGTFNPADLSQNPPTLTANAGSGFPGNWLLRAQGAYVAFEPVSGTLAAGANQPVDITFDGTSQPTGRYTANAAVTSNDPVTPRFDLPIDFFVADAVGEATVNAASPSTDFDDSSPTSPEPGLALALSGVTGEGVVTALRFDGPPVNVSGLGSGESASQYRWFVRQDGDLQFDAASTLRFVRADIPNPGFDAGNGADVVAYRRADLGSGAFSALSSTFDDGGTPGDLSDDAIEASGLTGFSEFILASETAPLPVELSSFAAAQDGGDVVLSWSTTSETNNAGFRIEHRADAETNWTDLGAFVDGAGTTVERQTYQYRVDDLAPNTYHFRLQQVDVDGTPTAGPTTTVEVPLTAAYQVSPVRPNPVSTRGAFDVRVRETQQVRAVLFNVLGQQVGVLHDGPLAATVPHTIHVHGSALSSGLYFVRVQGERFQTTQRLTLAR